MVRTYFIGLKAYNPFDSTYSIEFHFQEPVSLFAQPWDEALTWSQEFKRFTIYCHSIKGMVLVFGGLIENHPADEPDQGVLISVEVPEKIWWNVSNGRLIKNRIIKTKISKNQDLNHWKSKITINNYGINLILAIRPFWGKSNEGERVHLDMDYYVLREICEKAKVQFKDAARNDGSLWALVWS